MPENSRIRSLILSLDGVHTLYPADPAWQTTARRIRAALARDEHPPAPEYVRVRTDGASTTMAVRVGADGTVPAAQLARTIAAALRAATDGERPRGALKITVEVSAIRHAPGTPETAPAP